MDALVAVLSLLEFVSRCWFTYEPASDLFYRLVGRKWASHGVQNSVPDDSPAIRSAPG